MNIVYGGAFNPPTKAHLNIINMLLTTFSDANVIVLPVGNSYFKPNLIAFKHRYNMLSAMISSKRVIISSLEAKKTFDGTISSLNELNKKYDNLHLVIGFDHLSTLDTWIKYEELLKTYPLIIINRDNGNIDSLMKKYENLNVKYQKIAFDHPAKSTKIRKDIDNYKDWLPKEVYKYIQTNNLYGVNKNV